MCFAGWFLLKHPATPTERLYRSLFNWGIYWMVLGLFLEPYEGGIRKDKRPSAIISSPLGWPTAPIIALAILIGCYKKLRGLCLLIQTGPKSNDRLCGSQ